MGYKDQLVKMEKSATHKIIPKISIEYSNVIGIIEKANKVFGDVKI